MLIWLVIVFAVLVYVLGHAARVWMRTDRRGVDSEEAAKLIEMSELTSEEKQKLRERAKERLIREAENNMPG